MSFKVFSIEDIKKQLDAGYEVELSGFDAEENPESTFPCILRKVDLLQYAIRGKVPNVLAAQVEGLFEQKSESQKKKEIESIQERLGTYKGLKEHTEMLEWIAKESFVSPGYDEMEAAGIYLTQQQLNEVYIFQMQGVEALRSFRNLDLDVEALLGGEKVVD